VNELKQLNNTENFVTLFLNTEGALILHMATKTFVM